VVAGGVHAALARQRAAAGVGRPSRRHSPWFPTVPRMIGLTRGSSHERSGTRTPKAAPSPGTHGRRRTRAREGRAARACAANGRPEGVPYLGVNGPLGVRCGCQGLLLDYVSHSDSTVWMRAGALPAPERHRSTGRCPRRVATPVYVMLNYGHAIIDERGDVVETLRFGG
jgi:hypothetical protein